MKETTAAIIIAFILLSLSFAPFIYECLQAPNLPPDRYFVLEHNYPYDFNAYIAKMQQGAAGAWLARDLYTSELHSGSLMGIFFLLLGKIGGALGLSAVITYHLARLLLGAVLLLLIYLFISHFFDSSRERLTAFLLAIFSTSFPKISCQTASLPNCQLTTFMSWWSGLDVFKRVTFLPHHLFGQIMALSILILILRRDFSANRKYQMIAGFLGFLAGLVHPPSLIVVYGILTFWGVVKFIQRQSLRSFVICNLSFVIFSSPSLLYTRYLTSFYPWRSVLEHDRFYRPPFSFSEYALALGPIFFLGILGIAFLLREKKFSIFNFPPDSLRDSKRAGQFSILFGWVVTNFLLLAFANYSGLYSTHRFLPMAVHIPLGILSAYALSNLKSKRFFLFAFCLLLCLSLPSHYVSLHSQIDFINDRVRATLPLTPYPPQIMYPLKDWVEGIFWLKENAQDSEVILSDVTAGNYIPAYAGKTVFLGHEVETVKYKEKYPQVEKFFRGNLNNQEAHNFLSENRIGYVFFGPQEKNLAGGKTLPYPFLQPVFENRHVVIFKDQP